MLNHKRQPVGIFVLMTLFTSSLTVSCSFADIPGQSIQTEKDYHVVQVEKMVGGKLEMMQIKLQDGISERDIQERLLEFRMEGWTQIGYKTYQSGIILYDGQAFIDGNILAGTYITEDGDELDYKVIFSGKMVESNQEISFGVFPLDPRFVPDMA